MLESCRVVAEIEKEYVVFVDVEMHLENRKIHRIKVHPYLVERLPYIDFCKNSDSLKSV